MHLLLPLALATATATHADPVSVGIGVRAAAVPAGGDHGEWDGAEVVVETSALARTSLRIEAALDHIQMHPDEATYAYDGHQLHKDQYDPLALALAASLAFRL